MFSGDWCSGGFTRSLSLFVRNLVGEGGTRIRLRLTRIGQMVADLGRRFVMSIKMSYDKILINLNHQSNQWLKRWNADKADWADGR